MTDNKSEYLTKVSGFVDYLSGLLSGRTALDFQYAFSGRGAPAGFGDRFRFQGQARTFEDLFLRYHWRGRDYVGNAATLRKIQGTLRESMSSDPVSIASINDAIGKVMDWGLQPRAAKANKEWALQQRHRLPFVIEAGANQLISENPDYRIFGRGASLPENGRHHGYRRVRMNAGYTKVYSLLCEGIIIYDGRVGAAICWLVRQFLLSSGHQGPVPEELAFLWSAGASTQPRDPSGDGFTFGKLANDGDAAWARAKVRASWILEKARVDSGAAWCAGEDGLRKVECALFMLGYKLPRSVTDDVEAERASARIFAPLPS